MALNFPNIDDVHLAHAPLQEVICQVRFPPILRITHEEPVDLQERVRERFPLLEVAQKVIFAKEGIQASVPSAQVYRFHNSETTAAVSVGADFYAFSTTAYQSWVDFAEHLTYAADIMESVYHPSYAIRIGLRYRNELDASFTQSNTFDEVLTLLRPELIAILKTDAFLMPVQAIHHVETMVDEDHFTFRYGLVRDDQIPKFVLDFDYYAEGRLSLENLSERCNQYHKTIYNAFRWCIVEDKLSCFRPEGK